MKRLRRILAWVASAAAVVFGTLIAWSIVELPLMRHIHGDVPRLEFATDLANPLEFRARILDKRQYWLELLVYYDNPDERAAMERLVGAWPGSQPRAADRGIPTQFDIVVRDSSGRVVHQD